MLLQYAVDFFREVTRFSMVILVHAGSELEYRKGCIIPLPSLMEGSITVVHLGLLSIRVLNSKTIAPIDLILLHNKEYTCGSVLL